VRPGRPRSFLVGALSSVQKEVRSAQTASRATRHDIYTLVPALTAVVLGSIGMVDTSLSLGKRWGIPQLVIGTVVLAALTGLRNVLGSSAMIAVTNLSPGMPGAQGCARHGR
jgi:hypothetical protein